MPVLTAAVTVLGLTGAPGLPGGPYDHAQTPGGRTYSAAITRLYASGPGRPYGAFTGKSGATADIKYVSDSVRVYVSEGDISQIDLEVLEVMVPRVADSAYVGQAKTVSDSLRPWVTDTIQFLSKAGDVPKSVSDTIRAYVTEGSSYRVAVGVSDTVTPVVADTQSTQKDNAINVSDTITPVLSEVKFLEQSLANRALFASDQITVTVTDSGMTRGAGDVDRIIVIGRPIGRIRLKEA